MGSVEQEYKACNEDKSVILNYLYQHCQGYANLNLPDNKKYRVEVIDTWNMTRTIVMENVNGRVKVELPGKPYMAILALGAE